MPQLNVTFLLGGKNCCYFETPVKYMRFASVQPRGDASHAIPAVLVAYDLEQLSILQRFFGEMRRKGTNPEIYIWDLDKPEPEFLVEFMLPNPRRNIVEEVAGSRYEMVTDAIEDWHSLRTAAAANMDRYPRLKPWY